MPLMQWTPNLSVGVVAFDNEHKRLVALVNELFDAMQQGHGAGVMGKTLTGLVVYTKTHFAHEERLMKQHGFPGYPKHKAEHDELAKQVADVQHRFSENHASSLSLELFSFLRGWLTKHILGSDQAYTSFLNAKGVR